MGCLYYMFIWPFIIFLKGVGLLFGGIVGGIALTSSSKDQKKYGENIDKMSGNEFEYYVANLLKKLGYTKVIVTKASGDHGVDIIAYKDGVKYAVQCKRYSSSVGNSAVQQVFSGAAYYDCKKAMIVCSNYYTESAKREANKLNVVLWDRSKLISEIKSVKE